jgi:hypothetical protein
MASDHQHSFHLKTTGTYRAGAVEAKLRGNPPTIGRIPKFKRFQHDAIGKSGKLDFKMEGDRISHGNVSQPFLFLITITLYFRYSFLFFYKKKRRKNLEINEVFSGVAIVETEGK